MNITQAPSGTFYTATHKKEDGTVVTIYDRNRDNAMARLLRAIWPMPPANYFTEDVSAARSRPKAVQQKG